MKIALIKVRSTEVPFEVKADSNKINGFLKYESEGLVGLQATIEAKLELQCDRCGETFEENVNEAVKLLISDGAYKGIEKEIDVIESFDGFVDIDEILESEINLIKSDYHYCDKCQ